MGNIIREYPDCGSEEKKRLIDQHLFQLKEEEFYSFLDCIFLDDGIDPRNYALGVLVSDPAVALMAAEHLLTTKNIRDNLNVLKYFGGRIIELAGNEMDYRLTIPLLISAYDPMDYRDTTWSISMALAQIAKGPIDLILELIDIKSDAISDLIHSLKSYTAIDFKALYDLKHWKMDGK